MTTPGLWDAFDNLWESRFITLADGRVDEHVRMVWSPHAQVVGIVQVRRADAERGVGPLVPTC